MMLPILISVSLAPGSYDFCAHALEAVVAASPTSVVITTKHRGALKPSGMVRSPLEFCFAVTVAIRTAAGKCARPYRNGIVAGSHL